MKKQLIQEINRAREIMGLSIIPEQTFDNRRTFAAFMANQGSNVLTKMQEMFGDMRSVARGKSGGVEGFLMRIQNELGRGLLKNLSFARLSVDKVDINLMGEGEALVVFPEIPRFKSRYPKSLDGICLDVNKFNLDSFGSQQITGFDTQTEREGVNIPIVRKMKKTDGLYVFSPSYTDISYAADAGTAATEDTYDTIAGQPFSVDLSDSFADFEVTPDQSELDRVRDEMNAASGNVTRIAINSSADATGIRDTERFKNEMRKAGFPQYMEITNFEADSNLGDFSETEVTSGDRALAVVRGKYLAKLLGFDDSQVDYSFSLVAAGQPKSVTLRVVGQEDDEEVLVSRGQDATAASGEESFTTSETGMVEGKLNRGHIQFKKGK